MFVSSLKHCDHNNINFHCSMYHLLYHMPDNTYNPLRVGSVLTVPVSVLLDWLLKHRLLSWQSFLGVGVILIGFFGLVVSEYWETRKKESETAKEPEDEKIQQSISSTSSRIKIRFQSRLLHFLI